jgi:hypothetical protein
MDRAVDAASARQAGVGRVHDRISVLVSEVALHKNDLRWSEMHSHPLLFGKAKLLLSLSFLFRDRGRLSGSFALPKHA